MRMRIIYGVVAKLIGKPVSKSFISWNDMWKGGKHVKHFKTEAILFYLALDMNKAKKKKIVVLE